MLAEHFLVPDEYILATGALLSGIGSICASIIAAILAHRRARDECDKRVKDIQEAFDKGLAVSERILKEG